MTPERIMERGERMSGNLPGSGGVREEFSHAGEAR